MFGRLANYLTRHYKAIVVAWILLLIPALFFAPQVNDVLIYEETDVPTTDLPSTEAQDFIDDNFGGSFEISTIVVLQGNDILDNASKAVVFSLEDGIIEGVQAGRLPQSTSVISVYRVVEVYSSEYLKGLHGAYHIANDSVALSSQMLFGLPVGYQELWLQSNASAFVVYGIPDIHIQVWTGLRDANPSWSVEMVDSMAYNASIPAISSSMVFQGLDDDMKGIARGWYQGYSLAWNTTSGDPELVGLPFLRSQASIESAFPAFIGSLPVAPEQKTFLEGIRKNFTLQTWSDFHVLSAFAYEISLGELDAASGVLPADKMHMARLYLEIFYEAWNASSSLPCEDEFEAMVGTSVYTLSSAIGGTEGQLLLAIYEGLGWEGWMDPNAVSRFTIDMVSGQAGVEPWLVQELSLLPPDPSFATFISLANALTRDYPLDHFPVPLPQALIAMMVNVPQNDTMLVSIEYGKETSGILFVEEIRSIVAEVVSGSGIDGYVTGNDPLSYDLETSTDEDISRIDPITIILVIVLIGIFFRSLVASSIPPLVIGVALGLSFMLVFLLGTYLLDVHYSVLPLLVTSSLGAGCDYCIFILSRYREERRKGFPKEEAVRTSVTWAGESIFTSGLTVIIGFGVLAFGSFWVIQSIGVALALGIGIALLAALTLLPSVVMLLGDRVFWPAKMSTSKPRKREGYFIRAARFSIRHAKVIILVAVLISVPTTYLALTLETSYDFIEAMPDEESKLGLAAMEEGFGAGTITPTQIALEMSHPAFVDGNFSVQMLDSVEAVCQELASMENVQKVTSPTRPQGVLIEYRDLSIYPPLQREELEAAMRSKVGTYNTSAVLIEVVFKQEPFSTNCLESISEIRDKVEASKEQDPDIVSGYVGGSTAQMYDVSNLMSDEFGIMRILAIIGIYLVLMLVLGSIVSPARSILTILLSISWTLAVTMLVFQLFQGVPILWLLPMILFVVCLGLGMDYDIFITTRIREEVAKGRSTNEAIVHAMDQTGGVITACGIIMAAAFGTLMLSQGALLQQFGFALAFAILLDAMVVRIYLVPAIVSLLGKWNWYAPGRMQRTGKEKT
jgi:putative drug exporter of the RND superfamily